jgi:hypothetical protein
VAGPVFHLRHYASLLVEVLADLEKEVRIGRKPEDVVGSLAYKTPDMSSVAHVHHMTLLAMELSGTDEVDMRFGRPLVAGGRPVVLEGESGVVFHQSPEAEAFQRWQRHEFLEVERLIAKDWRQQLSSIDLQQAYERFRELFTQRPRPKDLRQAKEIADWLIDQPSQENALRSGLGVLGYPPETSEQIVARWHSRGRPPVREFAPYFAHVLAVELTFYIGLAADLISRSRPSNLIDVAYVHYLPFCSVFVSSDKLHARLVPLFLKPHQRFVEGTELKADLGRIDEHYAALSIEVRRRGVSTFGEYPPGDESLLVSKLWDLSLPGWRERLAAPAAERDPAKDAELIAKVGRFVDAPTAENSPYIEEEADFVVIQRFVKPTRGKWLRFPPEALRRKDQKDGG